MPCLAGRYDQSLGIYVDIVVVPRPFGASAGEALDAHEVFPGGVVRLFKAQFDTGAQKTCITKKVIEHYSMTPHGKTDIITVGGVEEVNTYIFTIGFLIGAIPNKIGAGFAGNFSFFPPIQGAEIYAHDDDVMEVLIGMDVISAGSLHVEAAGFFSFWF